MKKPLGSVVMVRVLPSLSMPIRGTAAGDKTTMSTSKSTSSPVDVFSAEIVKFPVIGSSEISAGLPRINVMPSPLARR